MITVNGIEILPTKFPDKTSQVWKLPESLRRRVVSVTWHFEGEDEFMHLAQLMSLLSSWGTTASLHLTYLPYGRQDKEISNDTTFALQTFAELINRLDFNKVTCLDPHSGVARKKIKNFKPILATDLILKAAKLCEPNAICYPDLSAYKKYNGCVDLPAIVCNKIRNQASGHIQHYELLNGPQVAGLKILIVDDICDGGMTFEFCAKALYAAGAARVYLFVTHGIFSKGIEPLLYNAKIVRIFTKDGEVAGKKRSVFGDSIAYKPYKGDNDESVSNASV